MSKVNASPDVTKTVLDGIQSGFKRAQEDHADRVSQAYERAIGNVLTRDMPHMVKKASLVLVGRRVDELLKARMEDIDAAILTRLMEHWDAAIDKAVRERLDAALDAVKREFTGKLR